MNRDWEETHNTSSLLWVIEMSSQRPCPHPTPHQLSWGAPSERSSTPCSHTSSIPSLHQLLFPLTDRVSIGSYRTDFSMTDLENSRDFGANDNMGASTITVTQETSLGGEDGTSLT